MKPSASQHVETVVIGAGPAGLSTAYTLAKAGRSVVVLEQNPKDVGGISRTVSYKGFLFDIGGHRFYSKAKEVVDLWNELLPNDFIERPRLSRIYYDGKFFSYPLKPLEALTNLGVRQSIGCIASYAWARATPIADPVSFHDWVRNAFGEKLFSIFFKTYTEKVWGMSCDEISADWAAQRIKGLDLAAAIRNALVSALRSPGAGNDIKTLIETFRYPRRGPGMMWEAAAQKIRDFGGSVRLGWKVEAASWDETRRVWTIEASSTDGTVASWTAGNLVSSAAIRDLVHALRPPTPKSHGPALRLAYRDFIIVALIAETQKRFPDNWIYIHDPGVKVGRIQNFNSWSPEMVPDDRHVCLGLEYFCFDGDGLWSMPDADLIELAKSEIGRIGLINPASVVDACVVRQPKAYPIYDQGYADRVGQIRRNFETSFPTLHLVGRNGMHKYNNQDHSMMTGILAARNIIAGHLVADPWRVNADAEYGEAEAGGRGSDGTSDRTAASRSPDGCSPSRGSRRSGENPGPEKPRCNWRADGDR